MGEKRTFSRPINKRKVWLNSIMEKLKGNNKMMVFYLIMLALGFITGIVLGINHFF